MPINLNFTDVKQPEPFAEGNYLLKVVDCVIKPGKENPEYDVAHMRYEMEQPIEYAGRKIRDYISFHPDSMWSAAIWVASLLRCEVSEIGEFQLNETAVVGETVGATLIDDGEYKGRKQMRIATYFSAADYQ